MVTVTATCSFISLPLRSNTYPYPCPYRQKERLARECAHREEVLTRIVSGTPAWELLPRLPETLTLLTLPDAYSQHRRDLLKVGVMERVRVGGTGWGWG